MAWRQQMPDTHVDPAPGWVELRFRAMGTDVHLAVLADDPTLPIDARRRIEELEARWSRFQPDSLLSRLNRSDGGGLLVDPETFDLLTSAVECWHRTAHHFDPTVHDAVVQAGYDRTFEEVGTGPGPTARPVHLPSPGCVGIELDPNFLRVALPPGTHLDLGGIGKGRTADLVAEHLVRAGARSALVNLGGDLRIAGDLPPGSEFSIAIEDPLDLGGSATTVRLGHGALATSSRTRRRWTVDGEEKHHLIDPATGAPALSGVAAVTVIAATATEAEVLAKAALVAGLEEGIDLLDAAAVAAFLVDDDGDQHRIRNFAGFEA